jgi:8-amino-7-oxononanoate synthase
MRNILAYSLADFNYNDNPDVLAPPADFEEWISHPTVQTAYSLFEQPLLCAPGVRTEILSNFDHQRRKIINLTSYNYLGLSTHPEVIAAAKAALDRYGLGASGGALLSGTFDLHLELAAKLAAFKQKDACVLYSGGLAANMGAIQGILRKGDVLVLDEKCHRSLVDGGLLSGARMLFFEHNNMDSLVVMLEKCKGARTLAAIEGVYSMDGDLPKLPEIAEICEQYHAAIYLDEAHSSFLFGENGRGVAEHFGLEDRIPIVFGTMSKALGGVGGFVCSTASTIRYLKCYSSPFQFSCALPPAIVAGVLKALEIAARDSSLRNKLWENVSYFKALLLGMGLNLGDSASQIIPIITGSSGEKLLNMSFEIQKRGLFLQPVDFPAVPANARRFRISVSSSLTKQDIDEACNIISDVIVKGLKT